MEKEGGRRHRISCVPSKTDTLRRVLVLEMGLLVLEREEERGQLRPCRKGSEQEARWPRNVSQASSQTSLRTFGWKFYMCLRCATFSWRLRSVEDCDRLPTKVSSGSATFTQSGRMMACGLAKTGSRTPGASRTLLGGPSHWFPAPQTHHLRRARRGAGAPRCECRHRRRTNRTG